MTLTQSAATLNPYERRLGVNLKQINHLQTPRFSWSHKIDFLPFNLFLIKGILSFEAWSLIFSIFITVLIHVLVAISGEASFPQEGDFNEQWSLHRVRGIPGSRKDLLGGLGRVVREGYPPPRWEESYHRFSLFLQAYQLKGWKSHLSTRKKMNKKWGRGQRSQ